jgi:hypothetical protein
MLVAGKTLANELMARGKLGTLLQSRLLLVEQQTHEHWVTGTTLSSRALMS